MSAETNKDHSYSGVYRLLVHGEDDLVGQIAYAIYKQHKIEKITRFTTQNKRPPTDEELASFMENAQSENQLRFYNERAVSILKDFLEKSLSDEVETITTQTKAEYDTRIDKLLADLRPKGFMYGVLPKIAVKPLTLVMGI